jgi:hypothetical protein
MSKRSFTRENKVRKKNRLSGLAVLEQRTAEHRADACDYFDPAGESIKLSGGMTIEEIIKDHPYLTREDIYSAQAFAADYLGDELIAFG